jgi:hypothetical protein
MMSTRTDLMAARSIPAGSNGWKLRFEEADVCTECPLGLVGGPMVFEE